MFMGMFVVCMCMFEYVYVSSVYVCVYLCVNEYVCVMYAICVCWCVGICVCFLFTPNQLQSR
jgi:hypothetical protein